MFDRIVNLNTEAITSIRLRKFTVGNFNTKTRECEDSWIEVDETNVYSSIFSNSQTVNQPNQLPGKFCGSLLNFRSTYYSSSQQITIKYHVLKSLTDAEKNSFEFEISFYNKNSLNTINKNLKPTKELAYGNPVMGCDRIFTNCHEKICTISSPGYPGIFLKNLRCKYRVENTQSQGDKIILVNDNLQLDATLCHFNHTNKHLSSSYFCDKGTRSNINCLDTVDLLNSTSKFLGNICGLGRMNKIVTDSSSLAIEFNSGQQGYFANTGFLFYALSQKEYLEDFEKYNVEKTTSSVEELKAIRDVDKLQVERLE